MITTHKPYIFANATLISGEGVRQGSVVVESSVIREVYNSSLDTATINTTNYDVIDCRGLYLMAGAIDEHVHFRDPGLTDKGDMATESRAAVAGGVTSFLDMPNTVPQTTTLDAVEAKMERASQMSLANYAFYIGVTADNIDQVMEADPTRVPGAKLFLGSSTGQMLVDEAEPLIRLFSEYRGIIATHAETEQMIVAARAMLVNRFGERKIPLRYHSTMRSRQSCYEATGRAVALARRCGSRLHVLHVTTMEELGFFHAGPISEKRITCETCPHYLLFTADSVEQTRGLTKCNPAIKEEADQQALLKAITDGRIDILGTDHAPHLLHQKHGTLLEISSGIPGVQYALPLMLQLAEDGLLSPPKVTELMCENPARLYCVDRRGFLREGHIADIVLLERLENPWEVANEDVVSRCSWTPYEGRHLNWRVLRTYVNGYMAYERDAEGQHKFDAQAHALPLRFSPDRAL